MDLYKDYLGNVAFIQVIKRGTADILEEDDCGLFLFDTRGEVYMLKTDDVEKGRKWLIKHEDRDYDIMMIYNDELIDFAKERYGFTEEERCYQGVWTKPEAPPLKGLLDFRVATMYDVPFIKEYYEDWYATHGIRIIAAGELFIAMLPGSGASGESCGAGAHYDGGNPDEGVPSQEVKVGFIGMHPEGSTGLLVVLPEYRKRGFAEEMEAFMCAFALEQGLISYGHVKVENEKSMSLQKKVGVEFWDGMMSWVFK